MEAQSPPYWCTMDGYFAPSHVGADGRCLDMLQKPLYTTSSTQVPLRVMDLTKYNLI